MKKRSLFTLATILMLSFIMSAHVVRADESEGLATQSGQVATASGSVNDDNYRSELGSLQKLYRQQLADYREKERQYIIAKQQYQQIQTLAALEEAVQRTKDVLVARDQVLGTYVQILRLITQNTRGIELSQKNQTLDQLLDLQQKLKTHEVDTEGASDRVKISQAVASFNTFSDTIDSMTAQALGRITLGNLQEVFDKTQTVKSEVEQKITETEQNSFTLAQKKRGFEEISRTLTSVGALLTELRNEIAKPWDRSGRSNLNNFNQKLNQVYAGLSRTISYLDEVTK